MEWTQRLRIRQLHVLVELYRSANMSHTAVRLNMTQPALSKWLAELESDLGVPLFERQPKGLVPTAFCEALIVHARTILAEIDRTQQTIELMAQGASGDLAVGATHAIAATVVPTAIAALRAQYPDVFITLREGVLQDLVRQLREGSLDYVVGRMDARVSCEWLRYDELYEETVRVITGVDHPLAGRSEVAWAETRPYGWIGLPEGSQLWSELGFELAVAAEPPPKVRIETAGLLPTIAILARSDLLGITSYRPAKYFCEVGRTAVLALPYASRGSVGLLSQRDAELTPIRKAFRECVMAQAERPA